jgi:N-acetylmuramoyl-L-alanine amidase
LVYFLTHNIHFIRGDLLAVVKHTEAEVKLLARLMRAEAESEGQLGMLMVGNVGINRVRAQCLDFVDINTIERMVFQSPGGFEATQYGYFYQAARSQDIALARRVINGERFTPATYSLWFYNAYEDDCMPTWWGQYNSGRYKAHCFYSPNDQESCY